MRNRFAVFSLILLSLSAVAPCSRAQNSTEADRKIVTKVVPPYPPFLRNMNIEGVVRADVVVAPDGKVKTVDVRGGHPVLVQSAEDAIRKWKWEPASRESHESVELRFKP